MRYLILALTAMLALAGCGGRQQGNADSAQNRSVKVQQTAPEKKRIDDPKTVAAHLESIAAAMPNVHGAQCVVFGNLAVVGINVDSKLERSRVDTIKYTVAEALHKDPYGANAIVTADMDLDERIRQVRGEIQQGRPIAGFARELGNIIGRIVPQVPSDLGTPEKPPAQSENPQNYQNQNL